MFASNEFLTSWGESFLGGSQWDKSIYKCAGRSELCSGGGWCHNIFLSLWLQGGSQIIVTYWWISFIFSWWTIFMQTGSWRFPWLGISRSGLLGLELGLGRGRVLVTVVLCHVWRVSVVFIIISRNAAWVVSLIPPQCSVEVNHGAAQCWADYQIFPHLALPSLRPPSMASQVSDQPQQSRRGSVVVAGPEVKGSPRAWRLCWSWSWRWWWRDWIVPPPALSISLISILIKLTRVNCLWKILKTKSSGKSFVKLVAKNGY